MKHSKSTFWLTWNSKIKKQKRNIFHLKNFSIQSFHWAVCWEGKIISLKIEDVFFCSLQKVNEQKKSTSEWVRRNKKEFESDQQQQQQQQQ